MRLYRTECSFETLIPFQENYTFFGQIEPFFGGQCHFTRQNRLFIDHSGMADAISVQRIKEMTERCQKRSCPSSPNSNGRWGRGGGRGGTVHLLNRQPAHLATGNLKQILGSPSQFFFCKSYPWENLAKEHSILVRIFGLEHHFVFNFFGTPCTSIYYTKYTK